MLAAYALGNSRLRKRLASWFVHPGAFRGAAGWHATSDGEAEEIRRAGFTQPIAVAANGVDEPAWTDPEDRQRWLDRCPELAGHRILLFFSRFHSKKGVAPLLQWWAELAPRFKDWHLLIAGTPHEFGVDEITRKIYQLKIASCTTAVLSTGLPKPYRIAELYVLPTSSENFGLTVGESLASGVPVLVSDQAPWSELNDLNCGRCVPLDEFRATLESLLRCTTDELQAMGAIGRDYVRRTFSWDRQARILLDFYATLGR
jgi:glycosyltransferase involved in cell wall biosynthesis